MSMEFFINEIIEEEDVKEILRTDKERNAKGKEYADLLMETGTCPAPEDDLLPLFILGYYTDLPLKLHRERGIPHEITVACLKDVNLWIDNYRKTYGTVGLKEYDWERYHWRAEIFRIGRLQFRPLKARATTPSGIDELEVHVPQGEPLTPEACEKSFAMAKEFFAKYYPELSFDYFVCSSWLLSPQIPEIMPEDSNLTRFCRLWTIHTVKDKPSTAVLSRVFGFTKTYDDLPNLPEDTSMQRRTKAFLMNGGVFYDAAGYRKA